MDHLKVMADVLVWIEQAPEQEKSKIILECLVKLLNKYKTREEDFHRKNADIALHVMLMKIYDMFIQQLQDCTTQRDAAISNLEMQVNEAKKGTYAGVAFIEINDYNQKKSSSISGLPCIESDDFYTGPQGYRMCARIYLNGDGKGRGTHLSICLAIKKGQFDNNLAWPFQGHVTFTLLNQDSKDPLSHTLILPDQSNLSIQKPTEERSVLSGCHKFVPHEVIEKFEEGFLRNNTIAVSVKVDVL